MVQPADQRPISGPHIEGGQGVTPPGEVDPEVVATVELEKQPATEETYDYQPPMEAAKKGQVLFNTLKLALNIVALPVTAPFAGCYMIGAICMSGIMAKNSGDFTEMVKDSFKDVLKPLSKEVDEIKGGLVGFTGKSFRGFMKNEEFKQQLHTVTQWQKKEKEKEERTTSTESLHEDQALQQELDAAARNLGQQESQEVDRRPEQPPEELL